MAGNTSKNRDASRRNFRTPNPNELTVENSVLVLIDHQPMVAFDITSIERTLLINSVAALAQT